MLEARFMPDALRDLDGLDRSVAERIFKRVKWLAKNFDLIKPEPLEGNWKGKFKFRVGDYRVVYTINRVESYLMVHLVQHRREVYRAR